MELYLLFTFVWQIWRFRRDRRDQETRKSYGETSNAPGQRERLRWGRHLRGWACHPPGDSCLIQERSHTYASIKPYNSLPHLRPKRPLFHRRRRSTLRVWLRRVPSPSPLCGWVCTGFQGLPMTVVEWREWRNSLKAEIEVQGRETRVNNVHPGWTTVMLT